MQSCHVQEVRKDHLGGLRPTRSASDAGRSRVRSMQWARGRSEIDRIVLSHVLQEVEAVRDLHLPQIARARGRTGCRRSGSVLRRHPVVSSTVATWSRRRHFAHRASLCRRRPDYVETCRIVQMSVGITPPTRAFQGPRPERSDGARPDSERSSAVRGPNTERRCRSGISVGIVACRSLSRVVAQLASIGLVSAATAQVPRRAEVHCRPGSSSDDGRGRPRPR